MYKKLLILISVVNFSFIMPFNTVIDKTTYVASYKNKYKPRIKEIFKDAYQLDDDLAKRYGSRLDLSSFFENEELPPIDLVLLHNDTIIGFSSFEMNRSTLDGHIYMIGIDKSYRRQGLGEKFLLKIIEKNKESGMKTISLKAHDIANSAAIKLYEKLGFEKISTHPESGLSDFKKVL